MAHPDPLESVAELAGRLKDTLEIAAIDAVAARQAGPGAPVQAGFNLGQALALLAQIMAALAQMIPAHPPAPAPAPPAPPLGPVGAEATHHLDVVE